MKRGVGRDSVCRGQMWRMIAGGGRVLEPGGKDSAERQLHGDKDLSIQYTIRGLEHAGGYACFIEDL